MKNFRRCIHGIIINILVDDMLYEKEKKIFDSILRSYLFPAEQQNICGKEYYYYVLESYKKSKNLDPHCYVCDTNNNKWIFRLMKNLEEFYADILRCTVIHGSCVSINNKNVLIMGEGWSGKTTLTKYLSLNNSGKYLDDDCIYIVNGLYIGFCMPLPMRNYIKTNDDFFIAQTMDTEGVTRSLLSPPCCVNCLENIDTVVLPKYLADGKNRINKLAVTDAFKKIINNIRAYDDMKIMYTDVKKLAMNSDCYEMEYVNSESAYKLLCSEVFYYEDI